METRGPCREILTSVFQFAANDFKVYLVKLKYVSEAINHLDIIAVHFTDAEM